MLLVAGATACLAVLLLAGVWAVARCIGGSLTRSSLFVVFWPASFLLAFMLSSSLTSAQATALERVEALHAVPLLRIIVASWRPVLLVGGVTLLDAMLIVLVLLTSVLVKTILSHAVDTVRILKFALRVVATSEALPRSQ